MTNEEIFQENIDIAYKLANQYLKSYPKEIDDIRQVALMELWRCIQNWDHLHALTTYAYICIPNKINMYLRYVKKHNKRNISLNTPVYRSDNNDIFLEDIIEDPDNNIEILIDVLNMEGVVDNIDITDIEKQVIDLKKKGLSQYSIGNILHLSQPQISRIQKRIQNKIERKIIYG